MDSESDSKPLNERGSVRRRGEVVERAAYANAAFVQALLQLFEQSGVSGAPRQLGFGDEGQERVSYLEGVPGDPALLTPAQVASLGRLLRRLHDASAGSLLAGEREIVRHGDPGPQNALFQGDEAIGYIDWEYAAPGDRLQELGEVVWGLLEARLDDRDAEFQAERITALCQGYGRFTPAEVVKEAGRQIATAQRRYGVESAEQAAHFARLEGFLNRHKGLLSGTRSGTSAKHQAAAHTDSGA